MTDTELPRYEEVERLNTMARVTEEMEKAGFAMQAPPEYPCPTLRPSDLTHNNMQLFAQKYAQFEGWRSYSHNVMANIDGWILECKRKMKRILIKARIQERSKKRAAQEKTTKTALDDDVESRQDYMAAADMLQELEQKRLIVQDMYIRTDNGAQVMSRYIEVRKTEAKHEGRHF